jgi:hypothetical protein
MQQSRNRMKYTSLLAVSAALALAAPGLALAACERPSPPSSIDGSKVSLDQLRTAQGAVVSFMTASDAYQDCINGELTAQRAAATAAKTKVDPALVKAAKDNGDQNQADKERVGAEFNAAVRAFKAAHPS